MVELSYAKAHFEANYGAMTPQDAASDRFGLNQCAETWSPQAPYGAQLNTIVPMRLGSPVRRLDLILKYWRRYRYHGHTEYRLLVHGRPMTITHYRDGRLQVALDDRVIYEQIKRYRHDREMVIVERVDAEDLANQRALERENMLRATRERLERASAHRHA